ncbi:MAG: bifunctional oligoribonuclease/PAP phosphatase NrnA [Sphingobacteriia bacterium]|nr:bifunctional oligoribonuclease/PAP phosphatase NrnA [Sphingobacteriia bacterium]
MKPISDFYTQLHQPKKTVITTHQKPDGDAMGSSLALYHFLLQLQYTDVTVVSPTNWAGFLNWMPGVKTVIDYEATQHKAQQLISEAELIFCLDFNVLHRTKYLAKHIEQSPAVKVLIDHHEEPQITAFNYGISNTAKSSTCEMVYDFIIDSGWGSKINLDIATCLYTGVMTDTGSFKFPSTTVSVHKMVAHLKELGLQHTIIHENIYDNFLENRLRFIGHALLNRMDVLYEYNTAIMSISKYDLKKFDIKTGDTEGLVNYLLTIEGIKLGAIVIDRDEERKWSFRSKGNFDVNTFARAHFEGGGHMNASGGRSSDSLENTTKKFYEVIKQYKEQLQ